MICSFTDDYFSGLPPCFIGFVNGTARLTGIAGVDGTAGDVAVAGVAGTAAMAGMAGVAPIDVIATPGAELIGRGVVFRLAARVCVSAVATVAGTAGVAGAAGTAGVAGVPLAPGTAGVAGVAGTAGVAGVTGVAGVSAHAAADVASRTVANRRLRLCIFAPWGRGRMPMPTRPSIGRALCRCHNSITGDPRQHHADQRSRSASNGHSRKWAALASSGRRSAYRGAKAVSTIAEQWKPCRLRIIHGCRGGGLTESVTANQIKGRCASVRRARSPR